MVGGSGNEFPWSDWFLSPQIRFDSADIRMEHLKVARPGMAMSHEHLEKIFQLCVCANGKLFLAPSHGICAGDDQTVCR